MPVTDRGLDARALWFSLLVGVAVLLASSGNSAGANPPSLQITAPLEGAFIASARVAVTWVVSDAGAGLTEIQVGLDSGSPVSLPGTATRYNITGVSDGSHAIHVTAVDQAGNTGVATVNVTVDTTGPGLKVDLPLSGSVITSSQVTVMFSTEDATSGVDRVEIRVDGGPARSLSGTATSYVVTGLADGTHTVTLTVFDRAGNSATSAPVSFRVDTSFFSPSGPYGPGGIAAVVIVFAAAAFLAFLAFRLKRRGSTPPSAPPSP
ncbi:MAG TPA: Ig-like domain-containing protein [Thermoplasmata archaeon]